MLTTLMGLAGTQEGGLPANELSHDSSEDFEVWQAREDPKEHTCITEVHLNDCVEYAERSKAPDN